jgi:peptidoglycan hydrolase-like protein with peptidoglycan-binding domain
MKGRLAFAVAVASLVSAGALLAQQAPAKAQAPAAQGQQQQAPAAQAAKPAPKPAAKPAAAKWSADQVKEAQEGLKRAKVYTGPVNGVLGPATRRAIRAFEKAHQMKQTGTLSDSLLTTLKAVP